LQAGDEEPCGVTQPGSQPDRAVSALQNRPPADANRTTNSRAAGKISFTIPFIFQVEAS
jgi:hypothetical protein